MPPAHPSFSFMRLSSLSVAIALGSHAFAEPAKRDDRHDAKQLDEIQVTASPLRGTSEQLSDPVSVLAGEALDDVKGATLGDTVNSVPGVQSSNFGSGVGRPIIRGLDGPRVAVLSGGLATQDVSTVSQDHAPTVEPFLADQIEVLKGPATLLYGSGAIGGVVNVVDGRIAETAGEAFSGRLETRYDSVSNGRTSMLRVDGGSERFALHADAVYRRNDNYDLPDRGEQLNSFLETDVASLGGSWLGDFAFVGISVSRYEHAYGNPGEPGDAVLGEPSVFLDIEQDRLELKGGMHAPFAGASELRFSAAHTDYQHIEFAGEEIGTQFLKGADEARIELTHEALAGWIGAVGLQVSDGEFAAVGEEAFVPSTQTRAAGVFIVEQRQWDQLQIDLGARVDDVSSDPDGLAKRSFNPYSLSAGAIWHFAEAWDWVGNLDHAERAPAEEELFANGPHIATRSFEIGDPTLGKEAANQLELGLHFHGDSMEAKFSTYYNRFNDFIFLVDTGEAFGEGDETLPIRQWVQSDARFRGLEGEVVFQLSEHWKLRAFGDTVRATLSDGGGDVPRIPPARAGAELRWANAGWRAALGAVGYGEQDNLALNETATDGYTLVNANAAYHWDNENLGWEVFVDARNLTDQEARVHTSFLKDVVVLPGRGISLGLRAFF